MSARESIELELKFDVDPDDETPDLTPLVSEGGRVAEPETYQLVATYLDTEQLDLAARRITLRRRTGGTDAGWHLKRPGDGAARRELTVPFDDAPESGPVPDEIRRAILAIIRDRELTPVATLTTERTVRRLHGTGDEPIAEFCDDRVTGTALLTGQTQQWREWEFELLSTSSRSGGDDSTGGSDNSTSGGDDSASEGDDSTGGKSGKKLLRSAGKLLRAAGARKASSASKLARTLGSEPRPPAAPARLGKKARGLDLVMASVVRHHQELLDTDPLVRENAPDAVHRMRVAARKLRSVLISFPAVLDPDSVQGVTDELAELGGILGAVRDREVALAINTGLVADEQVPDDLLTALIDDEAAALRRADKSLHYALSTDRYLGLLGALDALVTDPVPGPDAHRSADKVAAAGIAEARKHLRKAERRLDDLEPWSDEWIDQVHRIRKKAKALRYTADAAAPLRSPKAAKTARRAAHIQSLLGDFQDTVVNREHFAELTSRGLSPDAQFVLGRLDAREEARGIVAVEDYLDG
ncbi:MAG: CYTH and CHAD domain-containing protein [Gordonia sp. (in: high G+C Gram-positive bacteria)]|uniref:CYTH and CHAD domain-containing protein n=1 Tax=Gordonia sp. (in: high G+C Gram-positive bacteria) TaxID=84139 RepID=UPI0039E6C0A8